jgi:hypothetical protein
MYKMETSGITKTDEMTFSNALAVLDWLKNDGWKISRAAIYLHIKEGKLHSGKDGRYLLRAVKRYARLYLRRIDGSVKAVEGAMERKIAAEARRMEAAAIKLAGKTPITSSAVKK